MRGEIDLKGRGQEKQHRDVCGGPFIKKRLIKENNFAVWRNGEGGKREGENRKWQSAVFSDFVSWNSFKTL